MPPAHSLPVVGDLEVLSLQDLLGLIHRFVGGENVARTEVSGLEHCHQLEELGTAELLALE